MVLVLPKQALENNRRIQAQNNAPPDFPAFVRNGFDIKIMADGYDVDEKGLIYKVFCFRDQRHLALHAFIGLLVSCAHRNSSSTTILMSTETSRLFHSR